MLKAREGECTREGLFPLSLGGFVGPPLIIFLNFERFYVRFNGFLCVWVQILSRENPNAGQNCFQTVTCFFFTFFSSACFFDIISSMSPQVLAKYF